MTSIPFSARMLRPAKGFSLIELLIALVLGVILLGGLALLIQTVSVSRVEAERLSRMQENVRFAADYLVRDIRNAGFRDEVEISFGDFGAIGQEFAVVSGEGAVGEFAVLDIGYAGRGSCAEEFSETIFRPVRNRYQASGNVLRCTGFRPSNELVEVSLSRGISDVSFNLIREDEDPDGDEGNTCSFGDGNPCIGVRITLTVEGIDQADDRSVVLYAAFRNVILPGVTSVSF